MARSRLQKKLRRQTRDEGALRFDPQAREIREAKREVRTQTAGDVRSARLTGRDAVRSARSARPVAARSLSDALRMVGQGPSPGVTASDLGAAAARDSEGASRRLAETKAGLDTELIGREQDARAGAIAQVRDARSTERSEIGKLQGRLRALAAARGLFTSARLGELEGDERGRQVTRRGQDKTLQGSRERTAAANERDAANRRSREKVAADKLKDKKADGKKPHRATDVQIIEAQTVLDLARRQAKRAKADEGADRPAAAKLLIEGRKSLKDPKTKQEIPDTGYQSVKQLWASIALDLEYDGRISQKNRQRMRARGYRLRDFGIKRPNFHVNPRAKRPVGAPNAQGGEKAPF